MKPLRRFFDFNWFLLFRVSWVTKYYVQVNIATILADNSKSVPFFIQRQAPNLISTSKRLDYPQIFLSFAGTAVVFYQDWVFFIVSKGKRTSWSSEASYNCFISQWFANCWVNRGITTLNDVVWFASICRVHTNLRLQAENCISAFLECFNFWNFFSEIPDESLSVIKFCVCHQMSFFLQCFLKGWS